MSSINVPLAAKELDRVVSGASAYLGWQDGKETPIQFLRRHLREYLCQMACAVETRDAQAKAAATVPIIDEPSEDEVKAAEAGESM